MAVRPNSKDWKEFIAKNPDYKAEPILLPEMTAKKRSEMPDFISACSEAGIKPTKRQAAKYNGKRGRWSVNRSRVLN